MIDGALPALDVPLLGVPAPASDVPAADDPAAAELFATIVAQLLGPPAPTPAPAAVVADPKRAETAPAAVVPDTPAAPAAAVVAPEVAVREPVPRAPSVAEQRLAHTEPAGAQATVEPSAEPVAAPTVVAADDRVRPSVPRASVGQIDRPARTEPTSAHAQPVADAPPRPDGWVVEPAAEGPARPQQIDVVPAVLVATPEPAPPVDAAPAAEAPAPAAPVEVPVEAQVAAKVREVRLDEDGRHELTLDLHPAELGSVGVDVVVDGGTVHVAIRAEHAPAAELLRSSLDELRQLLTDSGLDVGDLSSHDGARHQHHDGRPEHRADRSDPVLETFIRRAAPVDGVDVLL